MSKLVTILALLASSAVYAGGASCKIDGGSQTVSAMTPDGVNWTLTFVDGSKTESYPAATFAAPAYNSPMGFTIAAARGSQAGILTAHVIDEHDISHSRGFYTKISNGTVEVFTVTCLMTE